MSSSQDLDFALDETYNLAFRQILRLLNQDGPPKQYEIWLREGLTNKDAYAFHAIPTGQSIYEENITPIKLV